MHKIYFRLKKKTHKFFITNANWLVVFREITAVYSENAMKVINMFCEKCKMF